MIVYSDRKQRGAARTLLREVMEGLRAPAPDAMALLIAAGMIEAGVVDAMSPGQDEEPPITQELSALMLDLAHAARGDKARIQPALARAAALVERLPAEVETTEPEGFAFYALYPDLYAAAARRFLVAERPERATVVGLRSIGTTLSAVVAAELEAAGVAVRRLTVRPRGHPFERELRLGSRLRAAFEEAAGGSLLVVDEGPGLSGSSFAAAIEAARAAGVPEARIHLFPSWDPDGAGLRSGRARALWPRHRRWVAGFEEVVLPRLGTAWGGGRLRDLSGGLWRSAFYSEDRFPATQPQHERRKYRLDQEGGPALLLKFTGLGARGAKMLARAEAQAGAGLAPPVEGLRDGFLAFRWLEARPVEGLDGEAEQAILRHLAHIAGQPSAGAIRFDDLFAMTRLAVAEGLGEDGAARLAWMEQLRAAAEARPAVAVDGRMMPHEWLRTERGILKSDGLDHHDDHFWPGTQDVAWDLAGAMVEWDLDARAREALLAGFEARTRDRGVREVLPLYEAGYLAWRLGYATLAAETLGESPDGRRMAALRDRYAKGLRAAIAKGAA